MDFIADLAKNTWNCEDDKNINEIKIGFVNNGKVPVKFVAMNFSYKVYDKENNIISAFKSILEDTIYKKTDQEYVFSSLIEGLKPDSNYTIELWVTNAGEEFSKTFYFKTAPEKPFDSWIFDESQNCWVSPVPLPKENLDVVYVWNEKNKKWEINETKQ